MRPEKDNAESRNCEAEAKQFSVRPRTKHMRPRPRPVSNESCNINTYYFHIAYKIDISQTELR